MLTTLCGVFVVLVIQHAMRMNYIVICGLLGSTIFSTLTHERNDFRGKKVLNINVCLIFSTKCV